MPLSHTCTDGATGNRDHLDQILSDLGTESRRLAERAPAEQDFERFEGELHELFAVAERALLAHELEQLDVDRPAVTIAGQRYHRVLRSTATYTSASGSGYRAAHLVPRRLRAGSGSAGVAGGHHRGPLDAAGGAPSELSGGSSDAPGGADTLRELGNMSPSKSSLDRLPKLLSSRWEEHRAEFEEVLRAERSVPCAATTVAVSLDGVMAPMKDGARQAKRAATRAEGRPTKGPAGYREVGCGTVSYYDCEGERLSTLRLGRMPEAKKATLKEMLSAEVNAALEQRPDLRLVKLADAAPDNWSYLGELAAQADSSTELIDFFHAAEQLKAATDAAYGENDARGRAQYEKYRHLLRHEPGGVERVIRGLRYLRGKHPRRQRIRQVLGYFRRNRHRMGYAEAAQRGLPIGSGVMEAACKTLATERLKRSGMRWREAGGQAILTLRGWAQSDRFSAAWSLLSKTYRTEVSVPDDIIESARSTDVPPNWSISDLHPIV